MRVSSGGARLAAVAVLFGLLSSAVAFAQISEIRPGARPIPAGPFLLYPSFATDVQYADNLFYSNTNQVSAMAFRATPAIVAQMPMQRSAFDLGYAMTYTDYGGGSDVPPSNLSHFFQANGQFNFASGLAVSFSDDYESGVLDTRSFDPGGEIRFQGDEFTRNLLEVALAHEAPRRVVGVAAGVTHLSFEQGRGPSGFFDTDGTLLRVYGESQRGARIWLLGQASVSNADLFRIVTEGELEVPDERERDAFQAGAGVRWVLSPGSRMEAFLSYAVQEYVSKRPDSFVGARTSDYRGLVGDVSFSSAVPGRPRFAARLTRDVFPSVYRQNDYYVSDRITVLLESPARVRLRFGGRASYYENDYPQSEPKREDRSLDVRAWVAYRLGSRVEWRVYARNTTRTSTVPDLGFDASSFGMLLYVGG
jgi:hypothetical protein